MVKIVKESNFETNVLKCDGIVVVNFWAEWFFPCKKISNIIYELSREMRWISFCKAHVEDNRAILGTYRVLNVPTILIFKNGELIDKLEGIKSKEEIVNFIKQSIS